MKTKLLNKIVLLPLALGLFAFAGKAHAQCDLQPIALSEETVTNIQPGTEVRDILNGAGHRNFGWLTWNGDLSEQALLLSLQPGGDSSLYINPLTGNNEIIQAGDWVEGKPGVSDNKKIRQALTTLETGVITVPVWDVATVDHRHLYYHIAGFANVQITGYHLARGNRISAIYLGMTTCGYNGGS